jgi:hypothetical protein
MPRAALDAGAAERAISAELIADFLAMKARRAPAKSTAPPALASKR